MKTRAPSYETQALREFAETLHGRRTVNLYLQTPVPAALLTEAIEAATWAPNHHRTEPWHFYRLGQQSVNACLDLIREIVTTKKDAKVAEFKAKSWSEKPGWIALTCRRSENELLQLEDYGACCAAAQNLMLYLWKAGVGCKWTSGDITRDPRFLDILGADADQEFVVGLFWYGYPKLTPEQVRKPVAEVSTDLP